MTAADDPPRQRSAHAPRFRERQRYGLVLALVVVSITLTMALPDSNGGRLVTVTTQAATLVLACWTTRVDRLTLLVAIGVAGAGVAGSVIALLGGGSGSTARAGVAMVSTLLAVVAPLVIAKGVIDGIRATGRVTLASVFGALSIYLLIGLLFANLYNVLANVEAGPFFVSQGDGSTQERLYFSFVTITTTGYGDFTPASAPGRAFAMLEAVIGQLYLVTIVALVVSNLVPHIRTHHRD